MKTSSVFTNFLPSRRNALQFNEFENILKLVPQAALLMDLEEASLALANSRACEVTSYTRPELVGMRIQDLFPVMEGEINLLDMDLEQMVEPFITHLRMRSRDTVAVEARLTLLGSVGRWAVLTFEMIDTVEKDRLAKLRSLHQWDYVTELSQAFQEKDLTCAMNKACHASSELLNAEEVGVYYLNGASPSLLKVCESGLESWMPEQIGAEQINLTTGPKIWLSHQTTATPLQKKARAAGMTFLVSIPLGKENTWIGLALIAGRKPPASDLDLSLPVLQANLTAALQIHTLLELQNQSIADLGRSSAVTAAVMNHLHDLVILLDRDMMVMDMNESACKALGYKHSDVVGQPVATVLIGIPTFNHLLKLVTGNKRHTDPKAQEILSGKPITSRLYRRSGNSFAAHISLATLKDLEDIAGYAIVIQDLSDLEDMRKRNSQLEQQALFGEMTANFVHDIKNPINNLKTGIQLLAESLPADSPFQANLKRLMVNSDNLSDLIKSGLSFIRPNEYRMTPVQLDLLLGNLLSHNWQQRLLFHQVKPNFKTSGKNLVIMGDTQALEHLFTNLFDNAVDAMRNNPPDAPRNLGINVSLINEPGQPPQVEVIFSDSGPGIPEGLKEKIFDVFYTTKETGSGLGLAIVKSITTAHRGVANVNSFVGGTFFTIRFPYCSQPINEEDQTD